MAVTRGQGACPPTLPPGCFPKLGSQVPSKRIGVLPVSMGTHPRRFVFCASLWWWVFIRQQQQWWGGPLEGAWASLGLGRNAAPGVPPRSSEPESALDREPGPAHPRMDTQEASSGTAASVQGRPHTPMLALSPACFFRAWQT